MLDQSMPVRAHRGTMQLLQIVTVGMGSPLGREVAPRELGALFCHFAWPRSFI